MNVGLIWNVEQAELQSCKAKIIECNKWKLFVLHFIKNEKVNKDKSLRDLLSGGKMTAVEAPEKSLSLLDEKADESPPTSTYSRKRQVWWPPMNKS